MHEWFHSMNGGCASVRGFFWEEILSVRDWHLPQNLCRCFSGSLEEQQCNSEAGCGQFTLGPWQQQESSPPVLTKKMNPVILWPCYDDGGQLVTIFRTYENVLCGLHHVVVGVSSGSFYSNLCELYSRKQNEDLRNQASSKLVPTF